MKFIDKTLIAYGIGSMALVFLLACASVKYEDYQRIKAARSSWTVPAPLKIPYTVDEYRNFEYVRPVPFK